jgi:hypothetical protein
MLSFTALKTKHGVDTECSSPTTMACNEVRAIRAAGCRVASLLFDSPSHENPDSRRIGSPDGSERQHPARFYLISTTSVCLQSYRPKTILSAQVPSVAFWVIEDCSLSFLSRRGSRPLGR